MTKTERDFRSQLMKQRLGGVDRTGFNGRIKLSSGPKCLASISTQSRSFIEIDLEAAAHGEIEGITSDRYGLAESDSFAP
jgi:hypothetical protein